MIPAGAHFWVSVAAAAVSAGLFAWAFASALSQGADAYSRQMGTDTSRKFEDLFLFIPPAKIAELGRMAALAAFLAFFLPLFSLKSAISTGCGILLGLSAGAFTFTLPGKIASLMRKRRTLKFEVQLTDALGTMSNALRAGFSLNQAFESVVAAGEKPISQEFSVFLQQLRVGMAFEEALGSMERRVASDDLSLVCSAIDIARKTGGNLTEIFDRIAETVRERMRMERRIRTLTAQGRLQGLLVSLMPPVLGIAMAVLKPGLAIPFFTSAVGIGCIALTAVLVVCGWLVIRKITAIDV